MRVVLGGDGGVASTHVFCTDACPAEIVCSERMVLSPRIGRSLALSRSKAMPRSGSPVHPHLLGHSLPNVSTVAVFCAGLWLALVLCLSEGLLAARVIDRHPR